MFYSHKNVNCKRKKEAKKEKVVIVICFIINNNTNLKDQQQIPYFANAARYGQVDGNSPLQENLEIVN